MKKAVFGALAFVAASCVVAVPAGAQTTAGNGTQVYTARLSPMNTQVTGHKATAEARLTVSGDTLTISIKARGVPPGMVHWQHFMASRTTGRRAARPQWPTSTMTPSSI